MHQYGSPTKFLRFSLSRRHNSCPNKQTNKQCSHFECLPFSIESPIATLSKVVLEQLKEKVQVFETCSVGRLGNWPKVYFVFQQVGLEETQVTGFQANLFSVQWIIKSRNELVQRSKLDCFESNRQIGSRPTKAPSFGSISGHQVM